MPSRGRQRRIRGAQPRQLLGVSALGLNMARFHIQAALFACSNSVCWPAHSRHSVDP
jgi:hypothetical protein